MAEMGLEMRSAKARLQYWQDELEAAVKAGDVDAQVRARQFVAEYKQLIASIEALSGEDR